MPDAKMSSRLSSLDGLRGVAALVVVFHHSLLCVPSLAVAFRADEPGARSQDTSTLSWWLLHTPVHLLWAGPEAVFIFFVLSGLVLVLPPLTNTNFSWASYYPRRLIRIYVPVLAALTFALITVALVPRYGAGALGPWLARVDHEPTPTSLVKNALLISGNESLITPLWSLRYEVAFSLLLPVYVWFVRLASPRQQLLLMAGALIASAIGYFLPQGGAVYYMPMFAVGALLAVQKERLHLVWTGLSTAARLLLVFATAAALIAPWLIAPWVPPAVTRASMTMQLVGASAAVCLAIVSRRTRAVLDARWAQSIGRRSFSLYLTHEPIVIGVAVLLGPGRGWWTLPLAVPITLIVAALFYRLVEAPSHRLARSVLRSTRSAPATGG